MYVSFSYSGINPEIERARKKPNNTMNDTINMMFQRRSKYVTDDHSTMCTKMR